LGVPLETAEAGEVVKAEEQSLLRIRTGRDARWRRIVAAASASAKDDGCK
jgi:hypothetical protein